MFASRLFAPAAGAIAASLLASLSAFAHDALPTSAKPDGWSYPFSCCSGYDCRAVSAAAISEKPEGFIVPSGEVVSYADRRVKDSPDGEFHWCSVHGKNDGRTICLFVPPRAY
ncbi:MAG: hypothetical protein AB7I79_13185 [Rhizobiaceae bacterium]